MTLAVSRPTDLEAPEALAALRQAVESLTCDGQTYPGICEALLDANSRLKDLDAQEAKITDPLKEALAAARAWFKAPKDTYAMVVSVLKGKVASYQDTLKAEKHRAIVAAGVAPTPSAMASLSALAAPPTPAAVSFRNVWEVEVTDASVVPRQWLVVDVVALRRHCVATKGASPVPGVTFRQRRTVAVGG